MQQVGIAGIVVRLTVALEPEAAGDDLRQCLRAGGKAFQPGNCLKLGTHVVDHRFGNVEIGAGIVGKGESEGRREKLDLLVLEQADLADRLIDGSIRGHGAMLPDNGPDGKHRRD